MSLPSFTVDFDAGLKKILYTLTGGALTQVPLEGVRIRFTSNIRKSDWLTFEGVTMPATAPSSDPPVDELTVKVAADGTLAGSGDPVKLLANDSGLNVTNVQWTARVAVPDRSMRPITFDAPTAGVVLDLSTVVPIPGVTATGTLVTMAMVNQAISDAMVGGGGGGGPSGLTFNPSSQFWLVAESGAALEFNPTTEFWEVV